MPRISIRMSGVLSIVKCLMFCFNSCYKFANHKWGLTWRFFFVNAKRLSVHHQIWCTTFELILCLSHYHKCKPQLSIWKWQWISFGKEDKTLYLTLGRIEMLIHVSKLRKHAVIKCNCSLAGLKIIFHHTVNTFLEQLNM